MNLSTRKLTSYLMIAGPIGVFVVWGILVEAVVGSSTVDGVENAGLFLQNASSAGNIAGLLGIIGMLFFLAQTLGLVLFARQLSEEGSSGAAFANLSALLGIILSAVLISSADLGLSAMAMGDKGFTSEALAMAQISVNSGASFGIFFSLSFGLVSIPMIGQASTNVKKYIGYTLGILMTFLLVTELFSIETGDIGEIVVWLGASLIFVAAGFLNLKEE